MIKKLSLMLLSFYQKYITILSYGSCRYHPTCSQYARWQFETNNIIFAFYYSFIRVLKCNQLFEGGFDYPIVKQNFNKIEFKKIDVKYWYIPTTKNNNYIIIKNWRFKNGDSK
jgi:putative membrane protein insertion efficiency factor